MLTAQRKNAAQRPPASRPADQRELPPAMVGREELAGVGIRTYSDLEAIGRHGDVRDWLKAKAKLSDEDAARVGAIAEALALLDDEGVR